MKYIKKNLQIVEPEINEDGYYVIGYAALHPDIFHQLYQPLGFTLTAEEVEKLFPIFVRLLEVKYYDFISFLPHQIPTETINYLLTRIKLWQDESSIH